MFYGLSRSFSLANISTALVGFGRRYWTDLLYCSQFFQCDLGMGTSLCSPVSDMNRTGWSRRENVGLCLKVENELGGVKSGEQGRLVWYAGCESWFKP